jgi:hypothetical protein
MLRPLAAIFALTARRRSRSAGRNRVLPDQVFLRHIRADVARLRAHVAVGQLEPGAGEDLGKVLRVLVNARRSPGRRVHLHRHVGVGHDRHCTDRRVLDIDRHVFFLDVDRLPLPGAGRALLEFPLVVEQHVEIAVVPLGRVVVQAPSRPLVTVSRPMPRPGLVDPAEALLFDGGASGSGPSSGIAVAVALADGVAAGGQGDGFLVVHRHAGEGLAHVVRGLQRIGIAVDALRVDVDQAHHAPRPAGSPDRARRSNGCTGLLRWAPAIPSPSPSRCPFPGARCPRGRSRSRRSSAHRLVGDVAGEDDQVGPADLVAVLLLDRPQQAARLVEVDVVRPGVERGEALVAGAAAAAAVGDAVGDPAACQAMRIIRPP